MIDLHNYTTAAIKEELARRDAIGVPVPLPDPDFSKLTNMMVDGLEEYASTGHTDDDFEHYVYEAALEAVFGDGVWEWMRQRSG